jgi:serine/threonine protein phosphatase PrpC
VAGSNVFCKDVTNPVLSVACDVQATGKAPEEQIVTADPDVRVMDLHADDKFLILACDGIWDMLTNDQAVAFVETRLQQNMDPCKICAQMCDHCLATHTQGIGKGCDNMSAMVVVLNKPAQ